jgi:hypothetical protein
MDGVDNFKDDLIMGMGRIAEFIGESPRRCYLLAERGQLPGVFKQGGTWRGLKSKIREGYERAAALRSAEADHGHVG